MADLEKNTGGKISRREITTELKESYLDYAMSVIVGRALPDARDGLKPVHRRILWAMWDSGLTSSAKLRKSANVVGETLGRYHPHGDTSVYDALTRMAQDFSLRYPLIQGQGNFGSIDGDNPAAMRYTECRLSKIAEELLADIDRDTVDFTPNYDASRKEPSVLPTKIPNMLINGSDGIAVGMATKIPPHNLSEVSDAILHLIEAPHATSEDLMEFIKGPDFPTGGIIYNKRAIGDAYAAGRGTITVRALTEVDEKKIVITEIPYQVNKADLVVKIAELVKDKRIEGIKDLRDESDREGLRIVIDLKSDAVPQKLLNQLYNSTDLQKDFHLNLLGLREGLKPSTLTIKDALADFIEHRKNVVRRRAEFDLARAKERAHILEGLSKALGVIDKIIATIKKSSDKEAAHKNLVKNFKLSDLQATAILEMKLQTLAALEREKIEAELKEKLKIIKELTLLLKSPAKILDVIKDELADIKKRFGDERRTKVVVSGLKEFKVEDLIPKEEVIITMSEDGYIKRLPPKTFKLQKRGGKGIIGSDVDEADILAHFQRASSHDNMLFFAENGIVYQTKAYEIPVASRISKGKSIHGFLEIPMDKGVSALVSYTSQKDDKRNVLMVTKGGVIKKTTLQDFANVRRSGIIAIKLKSKDTLKWVKLVSPKDEIILTTSKGRSIRFKESDVSAMGRAAAGVRGIRLGSGDFVSSMDIISPLQNQANLLVIMSNGFGKFTPLKEYRLQKRGGSGIATAKITPKTGELISSHVIMDERELLAVSVKGQMIKTELKGIRRTGRSAQGVRIMKLNPGDKVAGTVVI
ncbi:MAG: DNA gyrase subunit A [Candidatus Colwellbacteria bacterium]|nr:DNA gyrase subunit A [Candidatus Colwellbacteria bacterium]